MQSRKSDLSSLPKKFELVGEIKAGDRLTKPLKKIKLSEYLRSTYT